MLRRLAASLARISEPGSLYIFNSANPTFVKELDPAYLDPLRRGHIISWGHNALVGIFEPEGFVPPMPGLVAFRARGTDRERAMYFDQMARRVPAGLSRDDEPVFLDLDFLDGSRGAHVNISGISGVATKTTYATFLLYSLFNSDVLGDDATNTHALIFNVKGEDLLFLDHDNAHLDEDTEFVEFTRADKTPGINTVAL